MRLAQSLSSPHTPHARAAFLPGSHGARASVHLPAVLLLSCLGYRDTCGYRACRGHRVGRVRRPRAARAALDLLRDAALAATGTPTSVMPPCRVGPMTAP